MLEEKNQMKEKNTVCSSECAPHPVYSDLGGVPPPCSWEVGWWSFGEFAMKLYIREILMPVKGRGTI